MDTSNNTSVNNEEFDWTNASKGILDEVLADAEKYLNAQLQLTLAANQRAVSLASAFAAASTGIMAGLITFVATSSGLDVGDRAMIAGGSISATLFIGGAILCVLSIMPAQFHVVGNVPDNWKDAVNKGMDLPQAKSENANYMQSLIARNKVVIAEDGEKFRRGAWFGVLSPILGTAVWALYIPLGMGIRWLVCP